jgi:hypothetical protein
MPIHGRGSPVRSMRGSRDIRSAPRSVHREDVVAARDVVAAPAGPLQADIRGVEGFRVDGPDGRIGTVIAVSSSAPTARPDTMQVTAGLFVQRVVTVSAAEIVRIDDDRRRVLVRTMLRRPRSPQIRVVLRRFLRSVGTP